MTIPKTIPVRVDSIMIAESNDGGYVSGRCLACDESGWFGESGRGYPWPNDDGPAGLVHARRCPFGTLLEKDGRFRK